MRLLYTLAAILLITSCGTNKLRLVRHQKIIKTTESFESLAEKDVASENETANTIAYEPISEVNSEEFVDQSEDSHLITPSEQQVVENESPLIQTDSTKITPQEKAEMEYEALKAEKNAIRSAIFSPLFLFFLAISILVSFIFWGSFIPALASLILALTSYILGITFYSKAKRSRYITARGDRFQKAALVFIIIDSLIFVIIAASIFI